MSLIKSTSELSRLYPGDEGLVELEKQLVQHFFASYSKVEGRAEGKAKVIIDRIKAYRARLRTTQKQDYIPDRATKTLAHPLNDE